MSEGVTSYIILFTFLSVFLTIIAYELKKSLRISVAPILILLGVGFRDRGWYIGGLDIIFELINNLDPSLITLAILPTLLYVTSMSIDWYTFRREFGQIIPMSTTVVGLSSFLTAVVIKYILLYDFTWTESLLLGIMLNASDNVAVLAQLKDIYADEKFEALIGGETLLNEATVMVIFKVMLLNNGQTISGTDSFVMFIRLSLGGFALGLGFAFFMGIIIERIVNDYLQETLITVITAYLLFYTAEETSLNVSGALGVVTYGLYMSAYGKTLISPIVEKPMHCFWSIIASDMEAFVFIISGMILGNQMLDTKSITWTDVAMLFLIFIILHIIRFICIIIHYPLLKYFGYGIHWKEIVIITFSGIKGVISLAIALITFSDPSVSDPFGSLMLFFTIGIATLTVLLDGFAVKFFVRVLELETLNEVEENMLVGVTTAILQETGKNIEQFRSEKEFDLVKWEDVLKVAGKKRLLYHIMKPNKIGSQVLKEHSDKSIEEILEIYSAKFELSKESLENEMRSRFYNSLKAIYWHEFESGQCLGFTSLILINSCNLAQEHNTQKINDWDILVKELTNPKITKLLEKLSHWPIVGIIFKRLLYTQIMITYDAASTFIKAHQESLELMDKMEIDTDEEIFKSVVEESNLQTKLCSEYVKEFITNPYPEIISQVQSNMAAHTLLISQRKLINKIYQQGVIKEIEYESLLDAIDENIKFLARYSSIQPASIKEILRNKFRKATSKQISEILPFIQERHYKPESFLFREGDEVEGAYLIFNGRVHEYSSWIDQELIIGNIVGAQHLLPQYSAHLTTSAVAVNVVQAAFIPKFVLKENIFLEDLYKEACEELIILNKAKFGIEDVKNEYIIRVIKRSIITFFSAGFTVNLRRGGFLLYGMLTKRKVAVKFIKPNDISIDCYEDCVMMIFPLHLAGFYQQFKSLSEAFSKFYIRSASRNARTRICREENVAITMNKFHRTDGIRADHSFK